MRACEVFVHGIKAGTLTEKDRNHYVFKYDEEYLNSDNAHLTSSMRHPKMPR